MGGVPGWVSLLVDGTHKRNQLKSLRNGIFIHFHFFARWMVGWEGWFGEAWFREAWAGGVFWLVPWIGMWVVAPYGRWESSKKSE